MHYICVICCPFSDYKEYNTDTTVRFVVTMSADKLRVAEAEGLHKFFKLQTTVSLSSMVNITTVKSRYRFLSMH
jgi:DNA topoisomerase-2